MQAKWKIKLPGNLLGRASLCLISGYCLSSLFFSFYTLFTTPSYDLARIHIISQHVDRGYKYLCHHGQITFSFPEPGIHPVKWVYGRDCPLLTKSPFLLLPEHTARVYILFSFVIRCGHVTVILLNVNRSGVCHLQAKKLIFPLFLFPWMACA